MAERNNIEQKYKWDIEAMFPDETLWNQAVAQSLEKAESFAELSGHLTDSADTLLKAFRLRDNMWQQLEKAYVYARMKRDEDNRVSKYQAMTDKCFATIAKMSALSSFFTPELLEAPEDKILGFLNENKDLEIYRFAITETLRQKAHVLSKAEENIMAQLSEVTGASGDIFTMLNNADIKFGTITDDEGNPVELTHGNYITFMESHNRETRKEAFTHMYEAYKNQINTIATAYNYNTKTDVVTARIRKYESAKHAALSGDDVDIEVYDNLIKVVNDSLPVLHRYLNIRKKLLGVDEMKMYDVYVPLIQLPKKEVTFEDAVELANRGLAPLGDEYLERMNKGIASRWIDVYENEGKTSGAYSFGSYDSMPYILMNFSSTLKDVFTLVHEMGHSMHSSYTRQYQPFIYGSHSIFTAEVASTVNESLLMRYLLDNETDPEMRKYLLNMYIEEFRTTLFRQTMFAEFEDMTHKAIENGEVLTADWLNENYNALNTKYFGDAITDDEYIKYEWARIPHFYTAFYVYKYATGYSAATAISSKILSEGEATRDNYLEFLKTGDSNTPIELLKIAGVDMSSPEPIKAAMKVFASLVDEFEKLVLA